MTGDLELHEATLPALPRLAIPRHWTVNQPLDSTHLFFIKRNLSYSPTPPHSTHHNNIPTHTITHTHSYVCLTAVNVTYPLVLTHTLIRLLYCSGLGKPNFHASVDPSVALSVGVELEVRADPRIPLIFPRLIYPLMRCGGRSGDKGLTQPDIHSIIFL